MIRGTGNAPDPISLNDPNVDGVSVKVNWADLQPTSATGYVWTQLDRAVIDSTQKGKQVCIRIAVGGGAQTVWRDKNNVDHFPILDDKGQPIGNIPAWLLVAVNSSTDPEDKIVTVTDDKCSNTNPLTPCKEIIAYWSPALISSTKAMLTAVGARYASDPLVKILNVAATTNANTNDSDLPSAPADIVNWQAAGMTRAKLVNARCPAPTRNASGVITNLNATGTIDAAMAALPGRYVNMANGVLVTSISGCGSNQTCVDDEIIANANAKYPGRLILQNNGLAQRTQTAPPASGTRYATLYNNRPRLAFQMVWFSWHDDTCRNSLVYPSSGCDGAVTLDASIDVAVTYGALYVEIYEKDVIHYNGDFTEPGASTPLPDVIATAHTKLSAL